jgi:hypothetical protein
MRFFSFRSLLPCSLCFLLPLVFSLFPIFLSAQTVPLTTYLNPEPEAVGDTVGFLVYYGTQSKPVGGKGVHSLTIEFAYEGFQLDPASPLSVDMKGSWFGENNEVQTTITLDTDYRTITVTLRREDEVPQTGYGYLLGGNGGLVIEIDDIHKRLPVWVTSVRAEHPAPFVYDASNHRLSLDAQVPEGDPVILWDTQGRRWPLNVQPGQAVSLAHLPRQLYFLRVGKGESYKLPLYR